VRESLSKESKKIFPRMEAISFMEASTAHQKTILIDYDHAHGKHAVGYVMGLNSVTDYWDNGTPPELVRTPKPPPGQQEPYGNAEIAEELEALGIKTLAASLWTYDHTGRSTGDKYREIYIHSKLMIIDDAFFTLGSANLNLRSMAVDAEINIGCDDPLLSEKLRREVFSMHSGSAASCDGGNGTSSSIQSAFEAWQELLRVNRNKKASRKPLTGFLLPFSDVRTSSIRLA
jgi:phosphatidylserine/phosphatidylglycerophosphate/cardiolipin synthase-like enzyme